MDPNEPPRDEPPSDEPPRDQFDSLAQDPDRFVRFALLSEMGLGVLAILLGVTLGPDPRELVPAWDAYREIVIALGWGALAALPLSASVWVLERIPLKQLKDLQQLTEDRLLRLLTHLRPVELAVIALAAGVGEEMLFRGWLMMSLAGDLGQWQWGTLAVAIAISSVVFGLAHPLSTAYVIVTAVMGVYFALLLVWSENLLVPVVAHATYDFVEMLRAQRDSAVSER